MANVQSKRAKEVFGQAEIRNNHIESVQRMNAQFTGTFRYLDLSGNCSHLLLLGGVSGGHG
jgi:hypothetical protein